MFDLCIKTTIKQMKIAATMRTINSQTELPKIKYFKKTNIGYDIEANIELKETILEIKFFDQS